MEAESTAGEIGHTVVDPNAPICRCGNRGCLETLASVPVILPALHETYGEELTLAEAISRARRNAGCRRAVTDAERTIGASIVTLCNLLDPRRIVVSGGMMAAGDLPLEPLRESLARGAIRSDADDVEVIEGNLRERVEVLGAVALVLRRGPRLLNGAAKTAADNRTRDCRRSPRPKIHQTDDPTRSPGL